MRPMHPRRLAILLCTLAALMVCSPAAAQDAGDPAYSYSIGNSYFVQGKYKLAELSYEKAIADGARDAAVEYNLANTLLKLNRIGSAILHYERALELAPRSRDIRNNLDAARERIPFAVKPIEPPALERFLTGFVRYTRPVEVFTAVSIAWIAANLLLLTAIIALPGSRKRNIFVRLTVVAALVLVMLLPLAGIHAWRLHTLERMVVFTDDIKARCGPGESEEILFSLREGQVIRVTDRKDDWVRIVTENRFMGWIPDEAGEKI